MNETTTSNGFHENGISSLISSDSSILNLSSQVTQGFERVREVAQELSKNLIKGKTQDEFLEDNDLQDEAPVPLLDLMTRHEQIPKYAATLGFAEDGSTILHDFDSRETPHLFIIGGPNAGKTVMLRTIAASLALNNRQSEIQIAAICPITGSEERQRAHTSSWYILNYLPHMLCDIAFKHSDIVDLLTFLKNEISYREKHSFKNPRMVILIDQVDILIGHGGHRCAEPILQLAQMGDEVGIHLVLTAQSQDSRSISTQLLKELPTRLLGRPATRELDQNQTMKREEDAEQLLGEGDFLHQQNGRLKRMQGAYIGDKQLIPKLIDMNRHRAILLASPAQTRLRLEEAPTKSNSNLSFSAINPVSVNNR
jgi:DNA segregation ATPase FtsK/SpoIIIE-like protein